MKFKFWNIFKSNKIEDPEEIQVKKNLKNNKKVEQNTLKQKSIKESEAVTEQPLFTIDKSRLVNLLLDSIQEVKANDKTIYIRLNKNLIFRNDNLVLASDGLNIQLAKRIELNPAIKTKLFDDTKQLKKV